MNEVAARAGVSQATVSFVLGGQAGNLKISDGTRQRVIDVAREMGYQRNQLARAMITGKSRILGVLTSPESGENIIRILTGAVEAASSNDYLLKFIHLSHSGIDDATITRCLEWRLAGAMVVGLSEESLRRLNADFREKGLATAMVDNAPPLDWGIRIRSDDDQGIRQVVSHLRALGHRRIAYLGGRPSSLSSWREASFRTVIAEEGLTPPDYWILNTSWRDQAVMEAGARTLFNGRREEFPTAVVCAADTIAMVVQRVARSHGLRLPEDLSITGYSNAELSSFADPSLTSVDQSFHQMGHAAAMHLIRCADSSDSEDENGPYPDFLIPTRLVVRSSTAPPRSDTAL